MPRLLSRALLPVILLLLLGVPVVAQEQAPLTLIRTFSLSRDVQGNFDHLALDADGHRLFLTPEGHHSVIVLDSVTGKVVHVITGIGVPHAVLYRHDLGRIYVTDGEPGEVHIYDGKSYKPLSTVKLLAHTDSISFDPVSDQLYVVTGGKQAGQSRSKIAVIDTTAGKPLGDIDLEGDALEAMVISPKSHRLYINNTDKNRIDVVDLLQRKIVDSWPLTRGSKNTSMALDEANHLLFVGCRSGALVVLDTQTGKEVSSVPMTTGVDDMIFDPATRRIYASCGGDGGLINVFLESGNGVESLARVPSGPLGKTSLLSQDRRTYFVSVPAHDDKSASVLVYDVH